MKLDALGRPLRAASRQPLLAALVPVALLLAAACQPNDQAEVPAEPPAEPEVERPTQQYEIGDFLDTVNFSGASFSPDNSKILVSSNPTGIVNVHAIPVDGGEPVALTDSAKESYYALSYFPEDERFLYQADEGGNEIDHVYVRELDGSSKNLTPAEGAKAIFLGFAADDQSFLVGTNERDKRFFDVYEYQVDDYSRERIYENNDGYNFADLSPDRRYIALEKTVSNVASDLYLYDRETGETQHLTPDNKDIQHGVAGFSPDGKYLDFSTNEGHEFQYLVRHELATGERSELFQTNWDVLYGGHSHNGKYFTVATNEDAKTKIHLFDAATMEPIELPSLPDAEISGLRISRDETHMAFYASSSRSPNDLYVYELGEGEPRQLTRSLSERIDPDDLVKPEVVRFASFDGLEIPGVLYTPHQAEKEGAQLPALVWVHGGPGGQSRVGYSTQIQYLVNHGYVVYAINNRGSSGYGKTFYHLDDRDHGKGDLGDCVAAKKMLVDTGYVDPKRIGIIGGSYGGFMVLAALAFEPEEFQVGVDIFGVSNWVRTIESIPPWWEAFREALEEEIGNDPEYLRSISPLFHADKITKPLMVLQGANDPRVIQAESDDIVAAVRANGVPVEYLVFEDEGHGFRKKENREKGFEAILQFLDRYLKGDGQAAAGEETVGEEAAQAEAA